MVTIVITRRGVYDENGDMIPVGTKLKVEKEPKGWANKYEVVDGGEKSEAHTLETGDQKDEELETLRARYKELSGKEAAGNWGVPKLTKEIEALSNDN